MYIEISMEQYQISAVKLWRMFSIGDWSASGKNELIITHVS
jgi:hypothetical protein